MTTDHLTVKMLLQYRLVEALDSLCTEDAIELIRQWVEDNGLVHRIMALWDDQ